MTLRNHKEHILRLRKAALAVRDAASCQRFLDRIDRADAIAGIQRGLESMHRGQGRPMKTFLNEMREKQPNPRG